MPRAAAAIPDATWRAIESRDRRVDGRFVYGVTSTHIFCRPSCPSRRPRRDRVRLFRAPADAEAAGFRACRRCHPAGAAAPSATVRAVERARRLIDAHVDADRDGRLTLAALSAACGISPFHLQRAFRRTIGASPKTYADERRAARLRTRLKEGVPVTTATYDVGYGFEPRRLRTGRPPSRHDARRLPPRRRRASASAPSSRRRRSGSCWSPPPIAASAA